MHDTRTRAASPVGRASDATRAFLAGDLGMIVGGERVHARDGATFAAEDASTGGCLAMLPSAGQADVDAAVATAREAFDDGPWRQYTAEQRATVMYRLADLIDEHAGELAELDALESGLPVSLAREVDLPTAAHRMRYHAGWPMRIEGSRVPVSHHGVVVYTAREPVGVVAVISPSNGPTRECERDVGRALATGCTMVLKPSEHGSLAPLLLAGLSERAGIPPGVINVVTGAGDTGTALAGHPDIDLMVFTGSTAAGKRAAVACAQNVTRTVLQLGGKSPTIILPDADHAAAAAATFDALLPHGSHGGRPGSRLYVHADHADAVVADLVERSSGVQVGEGLDPASDVGPLPSSGHLDEATLAVDEAVRNGATLEAGGALRLEGALAGGNYYEPAVLTGVRDDARLAQDELRMAPVVCVLPYDTVDEVVRRANASVYGLGATVWSGDTGTAQAVAGRLRVGTVWINCHGLRDPAAPYGGFKQSGNSRTGGEEGIAPFLETKCVWTQL